ncbi:hypothetical protein [Micromonospora sp. NPDC048063]|uniref:hypothetical protein n=1 Tax=Micromonospora sp. NPDC048063 TaxID=3364256 RepID=UPI003715A695
MRKRIKFVLALTPADTRQVEAVRADHSLPLREMVGHAVTDDGFTALCGADVMPAVPRTDFWDDLMDEQWGPIRLCRPCSSAASSG